MHPSIQTWFYWHFAVNVTRSLTCFCMVYPGSRPPLVHICGFATWTMFLSFYFGSYPPAFNLLLCHCSISYYAYILVSPQTRRRWIGTISIWRHGCSTSLAFSSSLPPTNTTPLTFSLPSTLLLACSCTITHLLTTDPWCNKMPSARVSGFLCFPSLSLAAMGWFQTSMSGLSRYHRGSRTFSTLLIWRWNKPKINDMLLQTTNVRRAVGSSIHLSCYSFCCCLFLAGSRYCFKSSKTGNLLFTSSVHFDESTEWSNTHSFRLFLSFVLLSLGNHDKVLILLTLYFFFLSFVLLTLSDEA